jgi:hypothetical protein
VVPEQVVSVVAGDVLPDRKQAGSLFYIGLRRVERCPKASPTENFEEKTSSGSHLDLGEGTIGVQFVAFTFDHHNQRKISFLRLIECVPSPMFPVQSECDVPFFNYDLDGHFLKSSHQVPAQVKFS